MNKEYILIPAENKHIDQLPALLAMTGYWDFGLKYNELNLSAREFMREYVVKPYLPYTTVIVNPHEIDKVLGVVVCASKKELAEMPDYGPPIRKDILDLFKNIYTFEITESYHISFLAVNKEYRGLGLGKKLMSFAENKGKQAGYDTLSLYTFSCQINAIKLYLSSGMMVTQTIRVSEKLPSSLLLYFEKNHNLLALHNYFETSEFQNLILSD